MFLSRVCSSHSQRISRCVLHISPLHSLSLTLTFKVDKELVRLLFASTAITALSLTPFTVLLDNCDKTRNIQCIGDKFRGYLQQLHWGGRHGTIKKNFYIDVQKNPIPKECNGINLYNIYKYTHTRARANRYLVHTDVRTRLQLKRMLTPCNPPTTGYVHARTTQRSARRQVCGIAACSPARVA